jgi:integrase
VLASRFLALTAVRLGALRGAKWDEIDDLDGAEPLWRVPAARMKLSADKKLDAPNDHLIPLSPAAVAVLRQARTLGDGVGDVEKASDIVSAPGMGSRRGARKRPLNRMSQRGAYAWSEGVQDARMSVVRGPRLPGAAPVQPRIANGNLPFLGGPYGIRTRLSR